MENKYYFSRKNWDFEDEDYLPSQEVQHTLKCYNFTKMKGYGHTLLKHTPVR